MKRFILMIISSCVMLFASAQEEIVLDGIPKFQHENDIWKPVLDKPSLLGDSFSIGKINLIDKSMFDQPLLPDYLKNLDFKKYWGTSKFSTETFSVTGFGITPFYSSGTIYNQATYRLNDHFSFGGNSFGAQSVFGQPKINQTIQNMSTKGASMFIEYKVSDKFKVQTRVSISNHSTPWEP